MKRTYLIKSEYTARNNYMGDWRCLRNCILNVFLLYSRDLIIRHALKISINNMVSVEIKGDYEEIQRNHLLMGKRECLLVHQRVALVMLSRIDWKTLVP